jgi:CBS domain-containing protein
VVVVSASGALTGILTERDFLMKVAGQPHYALLPVRDFMTREPETVSLADTLAFALGKMDAGGYRHLPVVEDELPIGVISVRDILRHVTKLCQEV